MMCNQNDIVIRIRLLTLKREGQYVMAILTANIIFFCLYEYKSMMDIS